MALLLALSGCAVTRSAFVRTAGDTGSVFAAAATTLAYVHQNRLTAAYGAASFVNFQSELEGVGQQLPSLHGATDARTVHRLLALYTPAAQAVAHPCLDPSCNWRAQLAALRRAAAAFLKAGGG